MQVWLFPMYVNEMSVRGGNQTICQVLDELGTELEFKYWQGTVRSLPISPPGLVRASTRSKCTFEDLAGFCEEHGHLCFYDDELIHSDGSKTSGDDLKKKLREFLMSNSERVHDRDGLILYLRSRSADKSDLGVATHIAQKGKEVLRLWLQHGLGSVLSLCGDLYPTVAKVTGERFVQGEKLYVLQELRERIRKDSLQLAKADIDPVGQHHEAVFYRNRLTLGLLNNLAILMIELDEVRTGSVMLQDYAQSLEPDVLDVMIYAQDYKNTMLLSASAVNTLLDSMLPMLISYLVTTEQYKDSTQIVEWKY